MSKTSLRVLMVVEQCDPNGMSVPLLGYRFFDAVRKNHDVTLVTRACYKKQLAAYCQPDEVIFIEEGTLASWYRSKISSNIMERVNWALYHALRYPLYLDFNHKVYKTLRPLVEKGEFDIVHAVTPMIPRYPVKLIQACKNTPFILGPVNGGLSFPEGFDSIAKNEYANYTKFRNIARFLPGYKKTYKGASIVLSGSKDTQRMLRDTLNLSEDKLYYFPENGIESSEFYPSNKKSESIELLFAGRLVPYKGADIAIRSLAYAKASSKRPLHLTIVGDGPERQSLEELSLKLDVPVTFTGWIDQKETANYYRKADIFVFPSIREFGGAVVLEALACGLPSIVVDRGGIGEFVDKSCGMKIEPSSYEQLCRDFANAITSISSDPERLKTLRVAAIERSLKYSWEAKGSALTEIYWNAISSKPPRKKCSVAS